MDPCSLVLSLLAMTTNASVTVRPHAPRFPQREFEQWMRWDKHLPSGAPSTAIYAQVCNFKSNPAPGKIRISNVNSEFPWTVYAPVTFGDGRWVVVSYRSPSRPRTTPHPLPSVTRHPENWAGFAFERTTKGWVLRRAMQFSAIAN